MTNELTAEARTEAYLDALASRLRVGPARARRILLEVEHHLEDSIAALTVEGRTPDEAARIAVERFGRPREVARRFATRDGRLLPPALTLELGAHALGLAAVGLLAIGLSGLLAAGFAAAWGKAFVAGDGPGVAYTAERCADFLRLTEGARDCSEAATLHHFEEVVGSRLAAGVLGLVALAAFGVVRWRYPMLGGVRLLPESLIPVVGAVIFGTIGGGLVFLGGMPALFGAVDGAGASLSAGLVASVVAVVFAVRARSALERYAAA